MTALALRRPLRLLHTSARAHNLIGPSDPVSNLRPVIYDDAPLTPTPKLNHPYSLREFTGSAQDHDLQWKIQRQQLDAFNHEFWTGSNTRFESAKQTVLASLPESATPLDKEQALSELYRNWVLQEDRQMNAYSVEWRRRNYEAIMFAAKVQWRDFWVRLKSFITFGK